MPIITIIWLPSHTVRYEPKQVCFKFFVTSPVATMAGKNWKNRQNCDGGDVEARRHVTHEELWWHVTSRLMLVVQHCFQKIAVKCRNGNNYTVMHKNPGLLGNIHETRRDSTLKDVCFDFSNTILQAKTRVLDQTFVSTTVFKIPSGVWIRGDYVCSFCGRACDRTIQPTVA